MLTWLSLLARFYLAPLMLTLAEVGDGASEGGGFPRWAIIVIVVVVLGVIGLCCLIFLVPLLLGPSIGNVFSNVLEGLETPSP